MVTVNDHAIGDDRGVAGDLISVDELDAGEGRVAGVVGPALRIEDLWRAAVVMGDGSKLGKVDAVYVDDETERPKWVTVKVGWRGQRALVPLAGAELRDGAIRVPFGKARITGAPGSNPGARLSREIEAEAQAHYGIPAPPRPAVAPAPLTPAWTRRFEHIRLGTDGGVVTVVLDRPPVNALTEAAYGELLLLFSDLEAICPDAQSVVLAGAGEYFCAGDDVAELEKMTPQGERERMFHVREALFAVRDCPVPVIGALDGPALGTGLALAASCDFAFAGIDAWFGLPAPTTSTVTGAAHLARLVPEPIVRWMAFTGERVPAASMASWGGIVRVTTRPALDEALELAAKIAGSSPSALRRSKQMLNEVEFVDTMRACEIEQAHSLGQLRAERAEHERGAARRISS